MQVAADAVADELAHDGEAERLHVGLDRAAELGQALAGAGVGNRGEQGLLGGDEQAARFFGNLADRHGHRVVADPAALDDADVDLHHVPRLDAAGSADAVDDLLVDRDADLSAEAAVAEEGALAIALAHQFERELVDLQRGASRPHGLGEVLQDGACGLPGDPHAGDVGGRLDLDLMPAGHGNGK